MTEKTADVGPLPIITMLELSTAHIPKHTAEALGAEDVPLHYAPWHDYGWIFAVGPDIPERVGIEHPALCNLLQQCARRGVDYLKLDCDGCVVEALPTFDW